MAKRCIPGIQKWQVFAGGTFTAPGKHNYEFGIGGVRFWIWAISSSGNKFKGYTLNAFPGPSGGYVWIRPDGGWADFPQQLHRSPAGAAKAARAYAQQAGVCK